MCVWGGQQCQGTQQQGGGWCKGSTVSTGDTCRCTRRPTGGALLSGSSGRFCHPGLLLQLRPPPSPPGCRTDASTSCRKTNLAVMKPTSCSAPYVSVLTAAQDQILQGGSGAWGELVVGVCCNRHTWLLLAHAAVACKQLLLTCPVHGWP